MPQALAPLTAFAGALLLVWWLAHGRLGRLILDRPNARSLHEQPVPRTGGLGLHAGVLIALAAGGPRLPAVLWAGYAVLLAVSFLDDVRGLAAFWRLAVHLGVAAGFAGWLIDVEHSPAAAATLALAIAWMINLYNFMDGSDGLAGGMAVIGFGAGGAAAWLAGDAALATVHFCVAAAAAAFLVFNWPPARIFLGDAGSVPLGFLAAALGSIGWRAGCWPAWFPVLVFAPFVIDATLTLARRIARRERIWQAHRDHYYQRLVRMGWGHRRTALAEYALMAAGAGIGLAALSWGAAAQALALALAAAVYAVLITLVERAWRRHSATAGA